MHLLTQSALLRALGWSLFNSLWQMAFLWLVYLAFQHFFRRSSAHIRHGVAVLLLMTGTLWTGITFFNVFTAEGDVSVYELGIPLLSDSHWTGSFLQTCRQLIDQVLPWCSSLYLLTLCFLFFRYIQQYLFSRRLVRAGLSKVSPELKVFTQQVSRRLGIKKEVKVWFSTLVDGPLTLGSLKPVILVPLAMISKLTPQQVESLILHELAHIRRHDYVLHLWIAALEVIFFFNPFSKLFIRCIQQEREHRCDDMVLQFQQDRHTYVSALLAVAKVVHGSPRLALAATGSNDKLLLQRARRILQLSQPGEPVKGRPLLFLFLTIIMTGLALVKPAFVMVDDQVPASENIFVRTANIPTPPASRETTMVSQISVSIAVKHRPAVKASGKQVFHTVRHMQTAPDDESVVYVDEDASMQPADATDDEDAGSSIVGFASVPVQEAKRVYSIKTVPASPDVQPAGKAAGKVTIVATADGCVLQMPAPYVPNSSFSCQAVEDSSALPAAQNTHLQQLATHQVEQAVVQLQKALNYQLKMMGQARAKERPELKQQRQIILAQLKLQQQYLQKQQQLQTQLEKMGKKKKVIVVI